MPQTAETAADTRRGIDLTRLDSTLVFCMMTHSAFLLGFPLHDECDALSESKLAAVDTSSF